MRKVKITVEFDVGLDHEDEAQNKRVLDEVKYSIGFAATQDSILYNADDEEHCAYLKAL